MKREEFPSASEIYSSTDYLNWDVNSGGTTIHARRMSGQFRRRQWTVMGLIYGTYYLLPYLNWNSRQAVLFDIPARKFYLFDSVIWPQDLWMLALLLLFCFVLLFAMTSTAGRIFCGFTCPHTTGIKLLTWIEALVEGPAPKRIKLDQSPWTLEKITRKSIKHFLWLTVCIVTAITFIGYFSPIEQAWSRFVTLDYGVYEWGTLFFVSALFYINAGFVREQFCMWVCPYARIQGVLTDNESKLVAYDAARGEPRGKLKRATAKRSQGECIDCKMCVAVCPTGVDIRKGQQLGCINCGLCIDACNSIMDKVQKPHGLIRFASHRELMDGVYRRFSFLRPRPIIYSILTIFAFASIIIGLNLKSDIDINVRHERSPVFTMMSDGSIQNVYYLNLLNKTEHHDEFRLEVKGLDGAQTNINDRVFELDSGEVKRFTLKIRAPWKQSYDEQHKIILLLHSKNNPNRIREYDSMFIGPKA
jgi:cytochrome c oxidase accessory protein FixG